MPDLRVRVDDEDAERRIRTLALFLSDLRPFWPKVVPLVTGWWRRQFETEGAFAGRPWPRLSPTYAAIKARTHSGRGILIRERDLYNAAMNPRRVQTPSSLTLSIEDPKVSYHQEGDGVPARPLVFGDPLPLVAEAELEHEAREFVRDLVRRV